MGYCLREVNSVHIYRAKEIRAIDETAVQQGLSLFTLMENAGRGLAEKIKPLLTKEDTVLVLSGRGNNGGDGIVLARYLLKAGFHVSLTFPLGSPTSETARQHLDYFKQQGFNAVDWNRAEQFDVLIDCLLGIGTKFPLRESVTDCITWCNEQTALHISVDMPTGVQADRGEVTKDHVFRADYTFSLHGMKPSAFLLPSSNYYGKTDIVSIGMKQAGKWKVTEKETVQATLPRRESFSHKGSFGTSLLVAGSDEMPGSAL